jgi:glycosyltransferase involved in cell wall biosynthesis
MFSVVVACYNQESFVKEAVESALSQGYPSKEIIVVDDGSRDGTADVLKTFGESITLAILPVNGGALAARNHGASLAKGEYLVFLDGDDVLMPGTLEIYARLISARNPKILFGKSAKCYGKVPEVKATDLPNNIEFVEYANFLSKDRPCVFNTSTLVVDRSTFWSAGGWSPGIFYQDIQDLLTKLAESGKMILVLAPDTVWYRMHSTNAVNKVLPFLDGIHVLMTKAKAGLYPGGREHWVERSAWFGGLIFYWTKTALRAGLYRDAFILLASGWWMVLFGIIRRGKAWLVGRKPIETLRLDHEEPAKALTEASFSHAGAARRAIFADGAVPPRNLPESR